MKAAAIPRAPPRSRCGWQRGLTPGIGYGEPMDRHTLRVWALAILVTVVVIVAVQNSQQVQVDVLFVTIDAPLIITLLGAVLIGIVIGYIAPVLHRNRRESARSS